MDTETRRKTADAAGASARTAAGILAQLGGVADDRLCELHAQLSQAQSLAAIADVLAESARGGGLPTFGVYVAEN